MVLWNLSLIHDHFLGSLVAELKTVSESKGELDNFIQDDRVVEANLTDRIVLFLPSFTMGIHEDLKTPKNFGTRLENETALLDKTQFLRNGKLSGFERSYLTRKYLQPQLQPEIGAFVK